MHRAEFGMVSISSDRYQKMIARVKKLELERVQLQLAIYDCVNSPKGVVPDTAVKFYDKK